MPTFDIDLAANVTPQDRVTIVLITDMWDDNLLAVGNATFNIDTPGGFAAVLTENAIGNRVIATRLLFQLLQARGYNLSLLTATITNTRTGTTRTITFALPYLVSNSA